MLGPLDGALVLPLADSALHPQHQLLRGLRLPPQDRLGLPSEALENIFVNSERETRRTNQCLCMYHDKIHKNRANLATKKLQHC